ncbi:hypothetical protein HJG53_12330 [Sphingomonas sp. ID1715]|nr:hypothetical protein [Sphingomonas sp. ID1715]NNM77696.1 hypothetical protein [Sphingomonas sp. ID1715]
MFQRISRLIQQLLTVSGPQFSLCCHRDVGNLPLEMLRRNGIHAGRLR